jgi:hypothetical protein
MKKFLVILFVLVGFSLLYSEEMRYKPYILAGIEKGDDINVAVEKVEKLLTDNEFEIVGKYSPLKEDKKRVVICATHETLKKAVKKFIDKEGLIALATVTRFALFKEGDNIEISYRNLIYWGNAYFRKDFPEVSKDYSSLAKRIVEIFKELSVVKNQPYGAEEGLTAAKLRKYHFGIFMPYFDDPIVIVKNTNYDKVIKRIEDNFSKKIGKAEKVYSISFPDKKLTIYGCTLIDKIEGEKYFLPYLNNKYPKQDAYLPWEFLIMKDKIVMFNGKFFMALSYPDAGLGTFLKIGKGNKYTSRAFKSVIGVKED